jgi:hypothetical protein
MNQLNLNTTLGEWVSQRPQSSRVFETLQVNYWRGEGKSLQQACWERQLPPQDVLAQLCRAVEPGNAEPDQ